MKTLSILIGTIAPATAVASANVPAGDEGIFVWIFLGFFALIVVGQLIPAAMLIIGLIRGIAAKAKTETEQR